MAETVDHRQGDDDLDKPWLQDLYMQRAAISRVTGRTAKRPYNWAFTGVPMLSAKGAGT
jgi:hypothetical protein